MEHKMMLAHYEQYNWEVMDFFKGRPIDVLVINVAEKDAYRKFVDFFGIASSFTDHFWGNKS